MYPFRKIQTSNRDLTQLQTNVDEVFRSLAVAPFVDGVLLEGVALATGADGNVINHGLNRQPRGWSIVDTTAAASFYRLAWTDRSLTLVVSAATTASIWVF